jgi:hypothetical protein
MINTAVMVGEIKATDWASTVGKPSARIRNPDPPSLPEVAAGAGGRTASIVLNGPLLAEVADKGKPFDCHSVEKKTERKARAMNDQ